jgi:4'-phosphopantetheinyl transferase
VDGDPALLSRSERERAEAFRFPKRKGEWTAGRAAAKLALRAIVGPEVEDLTVETGPSGDPVVTTRRGATSLGVSITHAGGIAAAVAFPLDQPIGIDLEPITAIDPGLATLACNDREQNWLAERAGDGYIEALLRIWTAKEAAVKLSKTGLGVPLSQVRIESRDSELTELALRLPASDGREAECRVRVVPMPQWVAALAWFA